MIDFIVKYTPKCLCGIPLFVVVYKKSSRYLFEHELPQTAINFLASAKAQKLEESSRLYRIYGDGSLYTN